MIAATCLRLSEVYYFSNLHCALYYTVAGFHRARKTSDVGLRVDAFSQQAYHFSVLSLHWLSRKMLVVARAEAAAALPIERAWNHLLHGMSLGAFGDARGYAQQLRAADHLLSHAPEPMKRRQVWTLLGEALLALGEVPDADACGEKVIRLSQEVSDERGLGWGLYLRGWAASRLGDQARARVLLADAWHAAERSGDPVFGNCAKTRAAFACLLAGDLDEALQTSRQAAEDFARRRLRHPSAAVDGVFLAAAAAVLKRDGRLPEDVLWLVRRRRLLGRTVAFSLRLSAPLYWAGRAAWAVARGRTAQGRGLVQRAIQLAENNGLQGELHDVHALAAQFLTGAVAAAHADHAHRLRRSFASGPD